MIPSSEVPVLRGNHLDVEVGFPEGGGQLTFHARDVARVFTDSGPNRGLGQILKQ